MRGDIRAYPLAQPHHGNTWAWETALDDHPMGAKVGGFASTEESAMRQAEYALGVPTTRRVPTAWAEHAHLAPLVAVALQTTADRLGLDLADDYDTAVSVLELLGQQVAQRLVVARDGQLVFEVGVRETVTDLRDAGYSNRQISHLPIES